MKTICIHQPDFAPWLGFFDRLVDADLYVVFDDAQFLRRGWHHRDKILGPNGSQWLTVPVQKKGRFDQEIRHVIIDDSTDWRRRHLRTLESVYSGRPGFEKTQATLASIYDRRHERLIDLNLDIISWLLSTCQIDVDIKMSSELGLSSRSSEKLVDIMKAHDGHRYITGTGAKDYLDVDIFTEQKIEVHWQDFVHPRWNQGTSSFLCGLSTLDTLYHGASVSKMLKREEAGLESIDGG